MVYANDAVPVTVKLPAIVPPANGRYRGATEAVAAYEADNAFCAYEAVVAIDADTAFSTYDAVVANDALFAFNT